MESELVEDKPNLLKLVSLLRSIVRVKGLEAQAAEEELSELQEKYDSTTANVGTSERDLLDHVSRWNLRLTFSTTSRTPLSLSTSLFRPYPTPFSHTNTGSPVRKRRPSS